MQSWARRRLDIKQCFEHGLHWRRRSNEGAKGTVLYIHGLGESGLCFESLMTDPRLQEWNHLVPDLPGYGKTPWCDEPLGLPDFASCLAELLPKWTDGRVVVVGHSMGGVIGTLLAEQLAGSAAELDGFVNVEGNISMGDCGFSAKAMGHSLDAWLDSGYGNLLEQIQTMDEPASINRAYGASAMLADPRAFHRNSRELVQLSVTEELAPRMAALPGVQLFAYGAPRGLASRSVELLAQHDIPSHGIEDTGHWFYLEQQDAFVASLLELLGRAAGSGQ